MYISVVVPSAHRSRLFGHAVHRAARLLFVAVVVLPDGYWGWDCDELYADAEALYGLQCRRRLFECLFVEKPIRI
jgi:hypothetical protein